KEQRETAEDSKQGHVELWLRKGLAYDVIHRQHSGDRDLRIYLVHCASYGRRQAGWSGSCAHDESHLRVDGVLQHCGINRLDGLCNIQAVSLTSPTIPIT